METSKGVPLKSTNKAIPWSSDPTAGGIHPEKNKNSNLKRHLHSNVHRSTIYNSQDMQTTQVPINRQLA